MMTLPRTARLPLIIIPLLLLGLAMGYAWLHGAVLFKRSCVVASDAVVLENRLRNHVWQLAEVIGERHHEMPAALQQAADYIATGLHNSGLQVSRQHYAGGFENIIAELPAADRQDAESPATIVIGAHYDTVWLSPGADDNASGVAVLLELARLLHDRSPQKSLQFVAFVNEEQPFAETALMGSRVFVENLPARSAIDSMFSLEMLGYYADAPGSQQYPPPLKYFYPDTADFIAVIANLPSAALLARSLSAFRRHSEFPLQGLAMSPRLVPHIRRSDHAAFWDAGIPALMLTDTAEFRNARYHTVGDQAATLDYEKMTQLTQGLVCLFSELAGVQTY